MPRTEASSAMAKLPEHEDCAQKTTRPYRRIGYRQSGVAAIYERDPDTRQFKMIGRQCRLCGAVKLDAWTAWALIS